MLKKIFGFVLAATMLLGIGTTVSAAENSSVMPVLYKTSNMSVDAVQNDDSHHVVPTWNPGDGPAPQVTKIELSDYGWLSNGNFGVIIKVYGYGSDHTYFDGREISWIESEPFILYGIGADGFYYLYDCGPVTEPRDYIFNTTFTSTNFPHLPQQLIETFTFSDN